MELCRRVLNGRGMSNEWKTNAVLPIFKRKGDVMSCGSYRVKLLEQGWGNFCKSKAAFQITGNQLGRTLKQQDT